MWKKLKGSEKYREGYKSKALLFSLHKVAPLALPNAGGREPRPEGSAKIHHPRTSQPEAGQSGDGTGSHEVPRLTRLSARVF